VSPRGDVVATWLVMSLAVIPLLLHRPPAITPRGGYSFWVTFLSSDCR
jgi:hypothetical protein